MTAPTVTGPTDHRTDAGVLAQRVRARRTLDHNQRRAQLIADDGRFAQYAEAIERRAADLARSIAETRS